MNTPAARYGQRGTVTDVTAFTATVAFTDDTATDVIGSWSSVLPKEKSS